MEFRSYSKEIETALGAVRRAAVLCQAVGDEIDQNTLEKRDRSPVTIADFGAQALILKTLYEQYPGVSVIAEEDADALKQQENERLLEKLVSHVQEIRPDANSEDVLKWIDLGNTKTDPDYFWTLDPIDGTKGFLRSDQYAIALCLVIKGVPAVAALGCPRLEISPGKNGAIFLAVKGEGAYQLSLEGDEAPIRVMVSDISDLTQIRFTESVESGHSSHSDSARIAKHLGILANPYRIDSQAKYAAVSRGNGDAYLRLPRDNTYQEKIWDHASGALIVQEAGGKVTDINGSSLDFHKGQTLKDNLGVIVTNGRIHDAIIDAIQALKIGQFG